MNKIFDKRKVQQKTTRLAYEILEDHCNAKKLYLIAIDGAGINYGKLIKKNLIKISDLEIETAIISLDKEKPLDNPINLSINQTDLANQSIILIDDVANTGKTLFYAFQILMAIPLKSLKVAVLIDRKHKKFPISADYVGTTLNTTMHEHIRVGIEKNTIEGVYLV